MAIQTVEKIINGKVFKMNTLSNGKRVPFLSKFTKLFGAAFATFTSASGSGINDLETMEAMKAANTVNEDGEVVLTPEQELLLSKKQDADAIRYSETLTKSASLIVENMDKEDVAALVKDLYNSAQVTCEGKLVDYDFGVEFEDLLLIIMWIVEENFSAVFRVAGMKA